MHIIQIYCIFVRSCSCSWPVLIQLHYFFMLGRGDCIWYRYLPAAASRILRVIQSRIHAPRIVLPPSRRSRSCRRVAEAEAGPHASASLAGAAPTPASHAAAAAAAAGGAPPPSTLALATRRASLRNPRR